MEQLLIILKNNGQGSVMDPEVVKELMQHFSELSQTHQTRFLETDFQSLLEEITEFRPLQNIQKIRIENAVVLVLLGLSQPMDLVTKIKHQAEIARDRAEKIIRGVEKIILPLFEDDMNTVFDIVGDETETETGSTSAPHKTHSISGVKSTVPHSNASDQNPDSLDIFKKRLETPVHTATTEENVEGSLVKPVTPTDAEVKRGDANANPSSPEHIARDPYKETLD